MDKAPGLRGNCALPVYGPAIDLANRSTAGLPQQIKLPGMIRLMHGILREQCANRLALFDLGQLRRR